MSRVEWFDSVGSTNDVVAGWLRAGEPEVCVAAAREQTAGRGRSGRTWTAPAGAALLCSVGFRPTWLEPSMTWRLAAIVSIAMAEAAEGVASLAPDSIRLKWPNDLVIEEARGGPVRKVAGVLGETDGLGSDDPRAVIGIGINTDWAREDFPPEFADSMTSLAEASGGAVPAAALLDAFLVALGPRLEALRTGSFDAETWSRRQLTNGRPVRLERPDGTAATVQAIRVDSETGALVVGDRDQPGGERHVLVGEIRHLRIGGVV